MQGIRLGGSLPSLGKAGAFGGMRIARYEVDNGVTDPFPIVDVRVLSGNKRPASDDKILK
jgi:hypothetical protein